MEITPWILSWGAEVEVLSPPQLRDKIAEAVPRMSSTYSGAGSTEALEVVK